MRTSKYAGFLITGTLCSLAGAVFASTFNIPAGDLTAALNAYARQAGVQLMYSDSATKGVRTNGAKGDLSAEAALERILTGTGFAVHREQGAVAIVRDRRAASDDLSSTQMAAATAPTISGAALETVTVTSSKIGGDVQNIPIAITALSQEQLTSRQVAGGPDLVKEVPNLTFSKTNFTGYNIQIRGIGTQAISVTTDPAVAVAFNDMPFIRNHFFEQEFYDVSQVEVLRGPQGTLYGRNATAGVVNLVSAKPTDQFEAMASVDLGNYRNRRLEAMVNIPILDDRFDLRFAAEWTKRNGYSFNESTDSSIDGRDLWSGRATIGWKPFQNLQAYIVWEHFQEDDDRLRSGKQLCKTDPGPTEVGGVLTSSDSYEAQNADLSQGCLPASLYSSDSYEVPNGYTLPYFNALGYFGLLSGVAPYVSVTQSRNLRVIESALNPTYRARNDVIEANVDYNIAPALTFTSQTGFNRDFLWGTEDYNRFNSSPEVFAPNLDFGTGTLATSSAGVFCDPQLGCSNRLVAEDLSNEHAWQISQEFRVASNFNGPFNFSLGGNFLHYETEENYYVFINALTLFSIGNANVFPPVAWTPGVSDNTQCLPHGIGAYPDPTAKNNFGCSYIDPNPLTSLDNNGHNYFLSQNPYVLNSYAGFGEAYYNVLSDLKLTAGLRWTDDQKHFVQIPSWVAAAGWGYPVAGVVDQSWGELTGRFAANWSPKLDFTDQTLIYGSYAHGYKAGGANPPGAVLLQVVSPVHPLTFKPEFIDAFELGTKNTLADGTVTFNGDVFYYNYEGYQISQIVDRTSINLNFDAHVNGAELETSWEPLPGLKFGFAGGYEDAKLANGSQAIDLMDRTAGNSKWVLVKPAITAASNCVLPAYVVAQLLSNGVPLGIGGGSTNGPCAAAYSFGWDPLTDSPYAPKPFPGYAGFDPISPDATNSGAGPVPNGGAGFDKNLSGNQLPNAPHYTVSLTAEYTAPISQDWAATLHSDFYWQSSSWARVFNDDPYDRIRGYTNLNLALIFTQQSGWQVMGYLKNVFDTTAITGAFLNSDDTGLTTNVFLTDPRLIGVRVTKNF